MKILVTDYSFNAAAQQITFTGLTSLTLGQVLLVTNVTDNIIIYNFADATRGGTVAGNVLGLTYNTTAMSNTDALQIFIDVPETGAQDTTIQDLYNQMGLLLDRLEYGTITDNAKRLKVNIEAGTLPAVTTVGTVTTVTTVSSLTNVASIGGFPALRTVEAQLDAAFNLGITGNITF